MKLTPSVLPDAATSSIVAETLASEGIELGLTILQPLGAEARGVGAGFDEAWNAVGYGKRVSIFTRQG